MARSEDDIPLRLERHGAAPTEAFQRRPNRKTGEAVSVVRVDERADARVAAADAVSRIFAICILLYDVELPEHTIPLMHQDGRITGVTLDE